MVPLTGWRSKTPTHRHPPMQVRSDTGEIPVEGAKLGWVHNMGGACVASFVSVLDPLR